MLRTWRGTLSVQEKGLIKGQRGVDVEGCVECRPSQGQSFESQTRGLPGGAEDAASANCDEGQVKGCKTDGRGYMKTRRSPVDRTRRQPQTIVCNGCALIVYDKKVAAAAGAVNSSIQ